MYVVCCMYFSICRTTISNRLRGILPMPSVYVVQCTYYSVCHTAYGWVRRTTYVVHGTTYTTVVQYTSYNIHRMSYIVIQLASYTQRPVHIHTTKTELLIIPSDANHLLVGHMDVINGIRTVELVGWWRLLRYRYINLHHVLR